MHGITYNQESGKRRINVHTIFLVAIFSLLVSGVAYSQSSVTPVLSLQDPATNDQDDMCIWIHPDPSMSTIISSDKNSYRLFVYDLSGNTIQAIPVSGQPGNIDVRYNFLLSGELVDIVGYNDRDNSEVVIYKVDHTNRMLTQVANFNAGNWPGEIYGFCLYRSPNNGKHYAIASGTSSQMRQWELVDAGNGTIDGIEKRTWHNGSGDLTEGLVADDESGKLYAANEGQGVYKYDADPDISNPAGELIAPTGVNGLTPDVEGITLYYAANGQGYLLVSSQGSDEFKVYERADPHDYVNTFTVQNTGDTDGIDVTNVNLGSSFPAGIFTAHSGSRAIRVCDYADLGLDIDASYWNPRNIPTISVAGQSLDLVRGPTYKSNQSQVAWYDGAWWGVFRDANSSDWNVYRYNDGSWSIDAFTGISVGEAVVDIHIDEANGRLYVLVSDHELLSRLSYIGGSFSVDGPFPTGINIMPDPPNSQDDPACMTQAMDGDIFIFWDGVTMTTSDVMGLHSTDEGVTWSGPFEIVAAGQPSAIVDAIAFSQNGIDYIGIFVGEGNGEFSFLRVEDSDDPSIPSYWVEEALPVNPLSNDHTNMVRDADHNLYMIGKSGDSNDFLLFKRDHIGTWSSYVIQPSNGTRPALAVDETYGSLIALATVQRSWDISPKIQYTVLDKDNLTNVVGDGSWSPVLENGSHVFNDVTVSYQPLDGGSNLMVCATNISTGEVWYNVLGMSDISLPVFMAFFHATRAGNGIKLNWATHSEVANQEWIIYRREGNEGVFMEIGRLPGAGNTSSMTYYQYSDVNINADATYHYRLASVDLDGTIHHHPQVASSSLSSIIREFALYRNYPNPFNNRTTIHFEIGEQGNTVVDIFDILGRHVRRLVDEELMPGSYNYHWNARDRYGREISSGIYVVTLSSEDYFQALKMVLSR